MTIHSAVMQHAKHHQYNLHMPYIDYQQALPSLSVDYLLEFLRIYERPRNKKITPEKMIFICLHQSIVFSCFLICKNHNFLKVNYTFCYKRRHEKCNWRQNKMPTKTSPTTYQYSCMHLAREFC